MAPFRLQAQHLFITYPQCLLDFDYLYDKLLNLPNKVALLCLGRELHEDGNPHYHAYLKFEKKPQISNPRYFDIDGYHPNVQKCKSTNDVLKYVTKDGEYRANFDFKIKYTLQECLERANDEKDFIKLGLQSMDWKFGASYTSLMKLWRERESEKKQVVWKPLYDYGSFLVLDLNLLCHVTALLAHVKDGRRTKSLWLYGPSRTGKTAFARSLGVHCYIHEVWNAENLSDEADYTVYDDIDWEVFKRQYKSLMGCMQDITVTDKYRSKRNLRYNMPCIVLTNELPHFLPTELDWLNRNVTFIEINHKLY